MRERRCTRDARCGGTREQMPFWKTAGDQIRDKINGVPPPRRAISLYPQL